MDFLSGLAKGGDSKTQPGGEEKSSTTDLFSDAKVVAEAARAQFSNEPDKCDKTKAAGSAAELLDAASQYGKLDSTQGIGKYVDQAEGYLRQYGAPKSTPAAAEDKPASNYHAAEAEDKPASNTHAAEAEIPSGGDVKKAVESGEAGDYVKKAEESGEAGGYAKKAEELLGGAGEKSGAEGLLKAAGGFFGK
ncbi:nodulin-related protein 1-like [Salvia divinorum]|uniref:Nodulin-related protein 1-like n=1 Tax=Salvia divinorum TaxID=28513 RepID=A0ABD1H4A1_SALDI